MAAVFLHLEVDARRIKAKIIEPGHSQTMIKDECVAVYETLHQTESEADFFETGMGFVSQQMDLSQCSSAIIFVSESFISFRTLQLPFRSEKKIKQVLPFELETLLPLSDEAYISDFKIVHHKDDGSEILSASIESSLVDQFFTTLKQHNIKLLAVTPTGYAVAVEFLKFQNEYPDVVFVHISENQVTLAIFADSLPCRVRSIPKGTLAPGELAKTIRQTLLGYSHRSDIKKEFEYVLSSDDPEIETGAIYSAIEKTLGSRQKSGSKDEIIDPEAFICSISPDKSHKRLFNFCKGQYRASTFVQTYLGNIAASAALLVCAVLMMFISVGFDNSTLSKKVAAVDQEAVTIFRQTFPNIKKVQDPYLEMQANVKAAVKKAGSTNGTDTRTHPGDVKVVNLMGEISKQIDSSVDMDISRFLFSQGRLVLSGSTNNFNNVDKIKSKLESSKLFKKVDISSAASDKRENKVNFKFIIDL